MIRSVRGFTIIELLIVIVTIGVLLSIGIVSWGAYTKWANDDARANDTREWATLFDAYKAQMTVWPTLPASDSATVVSCLGDFPNVPANQAINTNGRCAKYGGTIAYPSASATYIAASGTEFTRIKNEIQKVGKYAENGGKKTSAAAGPFVYMWQQTTAGTTKVTAAFVNYFEGSCPSGFVTTASLISGSNSARYAALSSLTSGTTSCAIEKSFTYTPNGV